MSMKTRWNPKEEKGLHNQKLLIVFTSKFHSKKEKFAPAERHFHFSPKDDHASQSLGVKSTGQEPLHPDKPI